MNARSANQNQVKTQAAQTGSRPAEGLLQRKCACGTHTFSGGQCESCRKEKASINLQRAATNARPVNEVPPVVNEVLRSSGEPLAPATRSFMEPRFGRDFSHVRVHNNPMAANAARAVNALAFTVGQDIVFGAGQFQTGTHAGRQLLAHELAHTLQQGTTRSLLPARLEMTTPEDATEHHAEAMASAAMRGQPFASVLREPLKLSRQTPLQSVPTQRTTPMPAPRQQADAGPEVVVVPDKKTGKTRVFVNNMQIYEVEFPTAQGGMKTESSWNASTQQFKLKITVTQGAKVVMSPNAKELAKTIPDVELVVTELSPVKGLPVLVPESLPKTLKGLPTDPDLKRGVKTVEDKAPLFTEVEAESSSPAGGAAESRTTATAEPEGLWDSIGEWVHGALDLIGWIPIFGEIADAINAIIYLVEGRYAEALISGIAIIPIVGDLGKLGKWTVKGAKELGEKVVQQGTKEIIEGATGKGVRGFAEDAAKKGGKEATESSIERTEKEMVETAAEREEKEAIEETSEQTAKPKESEKAKKPEDKKPKDKKKQEQRQRSKRCTEAEQILLHDAVNLACKGPKSSCNPQLDSVNLMLTKAAIAQGCVTARSKYQQKCWRKTDPGWVTHQEKTAEFRKVAYDCLQMAKAKWALEKKYGAK